MYCDVLNSVKKFQNNYEGYEKGVNSKIKIQKLGVKYNQSALKVIICVIEQYLF